MIDKAKPATPSPGEALGMSPLCPDESGSPSSSPALPDRYTLLSLVGEGGVGRVYKGHDRDLDRCVAIKILRDEDEASTARLLREARAQARIEHENICRVYDVGISRGRSYIAMQYLDGGTLAQAGAQLTLGEKVLVIRKVAEALHEAHRLGLVHRDVKPSNIILALGADGAWQPYVLDFGLVREVGSSNSTTGVVAGTPAYLSPEQARGDTSSVDRRTDVYGIGATLFELLTGRAPFVGSTSVDIIVQVLTDDPPPPRQFDRSLPADLETIVLKCLEKNPDRRYDSARALADDLQRFLDGVPVLARPAAMPRRIARWAMRHRALASALAVALLFLLGAGGMALRAGANARRQSRLASDYSEEISYVERLVDFSHRSPLHDTTNEVRVARLRLAALERRIAHDGPLAKGPGSFALGSAYLKLGEFGRAHDYLMMAWWSGYQTRDVAYALGRSLGELYQQQLEDAERIPQLTARNIRKRSIENSYRAPALEFLARSRGIASESPAYVEALIAFYDNRFSDTLASLRAARASFPWLYEAWALEAKTRTAIASRGRDEGQYEEALEQYQQADLAYRAALRIAPSDAETYAGSCALWIDVMQLESYRGGDLQPYYDRALTACRQSILTRPDLPGALALSARAETLWGADQLGRGIDPRPALERAVAVSARAIAIDPSDEQAHADLGGAWWWRAVYEFSHGADPRPSLDRVAAAYTQATHLNPAFADAFGRLGNAELLRADYERTHGTDPDRSLTAAANAFENALALTPSVVTWNNLGFARMYRAEYLASQGRDPEPSFAASIDALKHAVKLGANLAAPHNSLATACARRAEFLLSNNRHPGDAIACGAAAADRAAELNPRNWESAMLRGWIHGLEARAAARSGNDPLPLFDAAEEDLARALELNPDPLVYHHIGQIRIWRAELLPVGAPRQAALHSAIAALDECLARNSDRAESLALRGTALARLANANGSSQNSWERREAVQALERALSINRNLEPQLLPLVRQLSAGGRAQ